MSEHTSQLSPLMQAATWAREHQQHGSPAHHCDAVATKDLAGFTVAEFCGVCGRCMSYRPDGSSNA